MATDDIKYFDYEEIKRNNGKDTNRIWIVIKNGVYDVTDFVEKHPGGPEIIRDYAGKDCSSDFEDIGHSTEAKNILKKFKIGEIKLEKSDSNLNKTGGTNQHKEKNEKSCLSILTCGCCG